MNEEASLSIWAALGSGWPGALGWGNGEVWELYRGSGSTLKHRGSLGRPGVLGWEAATAEESLEADSPSPRAISTGFVLDTLLPSYFSTLGLMDSPSWLPWFCPPPSLITRGMGLCHPPSRVGLLGDVSGSPAWATTWYS